MSHSPASRQGLGRQAGMPWQLAATTCAALLLLSACNDKDTPATSAAPSAAPVSPAGSTAMQPAAYTPPSAEVLYQMVAPIALYPDKLVAQILAGATYPDQIGAAETWLAQNPGLQKTALTNAVNAQNWDPSVKSLTQFPNVLEQMASNLPWTTALGKAYYNDPSDVMNAIQVMRNRAYKAGTLKTSKQLRVNVAATPSAMAYTPGAMVTPLPEPVIESPEQYIEIAPSQVDTVYVPQYDPGVVYGEPLPVYDGYQYVEVPPPVAVAGVPVVAGLLGFGAGIVLAESMERHPSWGWNSWNMHWGDPDRRWHHGDRPPPPQARPAVVYNNTTYVSQSRTVVQNIRRTDNVSNIYENGGPPSHAAPPMQPQAAGAFAPPHGPQAGSLAAGAAGAAVGAAALVAGSHALNQGPRQGQHPPPSPLTAVPQGRSGLVQGQPPAAPVTPSRGLAAMPAGAAHGPNALMQPREQRGPAGPGLAAPGLAGPAHPPQAAQAGLMEKAQQQRAQEQAQRQQLMQQQTQAREQQQHQQQIQAQQQRAQDQAQHQQLMQQQQAREQQQHQQQIQVQQQRAQEQAQHQQLMQQQAREQQQAQMQQQRAQEQAQRQAQMQQQQRAQEQAQRQQMMQQQAQAREQQQRQQQAQMQAQMQAQQRAAQQAAQQQAQRAQQQQAEQQARMQMMQARQAAAAHTESRPHGEQGRRENR